MSGVSADRGQWGLGCLFQVQQVPSGDHYEGSGVSVGEEVPVSQPHLLAPSWSLLGYPGPHSLLGHGLSRPITQSPTLAPPEAAGQLPTGWEALSHSWFRLKPIITTGIKFFKRSHKKM